MTEKEEIRERKPKEVLFSGSQKVASAVTRPEVVEEKKDIKRLIQDAQRKKVEVDDPKIKREEQRKAEEELQKKLEQERKAEQKRVEEAKRKQETKQESAATASADAPAESEAKAPVKPDSFKLGVHCEVCFKRVYPMERFAIGKL
jgi:hypothetical protein